MSTTFQLSVDEVHRALDEFDPVALVTSDLTGADPAPCFVTEVLGPAEPLLAVEDPVLSTRFLLPVRALRAIRGACLAVAAARLFVPHGAVTVSVLGSGLSAELMVRMVARRVPGVTHLAVHVVAGPVGHVVTPRVVDELDLSGIGLAVAADIADAAFGANLVVVSGGTPAPLELDQLAKRVTVVNGGGWDLPASVLDAALIYVDDLRLVERNRHRCFAREPVPGVRGAPVRRRQRPRRVVGDLAGLLTGGPPDRPPTGPSGASPGGPAGVVLVEVLGESALSTSLAHRLAMAAHRLGLGEQINYRTTTRELA